MKKVIRKDVEERFINDTIQFISKEGLTINNVEECMESVYQYMQENASLGEDYRVNNNGSLLKN